MAKRKRGTPPYVPPFVPCANCVNGWIEDAAGLARRCSCWRAYQDRVSRAQSPERVA